MKKTFLLISLIVVLICPLVSCGEEKTPYFADETALAGTTWTREGALPALTALNSALADYPPTAPCDIVFGPDGTWSLQLLAGAVIPGYPGADTDMASVAGGTYELFGDGVVFTILNPPEAEAAGMGSLPAGFSAAGTLVVSEMAGGGEFTKVASRTAPYFANDAALAGTAWTCSGALPLLVTSNPALSAYPDAAPCTIVFGPNSTWMLQLLGQGMGMPLAVGEMVPVAGGTFQLLGNAVILTIPGLDTPIPSAFSAADTLKITQLAGGGTLTKTTYTPQPAPYFANEAALANTTWTCSGALTFLVAANSALSGYSPELPCNIVFGPSATWKVQLDAMGMGAASESGTMMDVPGVAGTFQLMGNGVMLAITGTTTAIPAGFSSATSLGISDLAGGGTLTKAP